MNSRFLNSPVGGFHSGEAIFVRPQSDFLVETIELQLCQLAPERLELWQELLGSLQQFVDLLLVDTDRGLIVPLGDRDALRSYLQEVPTERIIDLQD
jgi:hypothetical protein